MCCVRVGAGTDMAATSAAGGAPGPRVVYVSAASRNRRHDQRPTSASAALGRGTRADAAWRRDGGDLHTLQRGSQREIDFEAYYSLWRTIASSSGPALPPHKRIPRGRGAPPHWPASARVAFGALPPHSPVRAAATTAKKTKAQFRKQRMAQMRKLYGMDPTDGGRGPASGASIGGGTGGPADASGTPRHTSPPHTSSEPPARRGELSTMRAPSAAPAAWDLVGSPSPAAAAAAAAEAVKAAREAWYPHASGVIGAAPPLPDHAPHTGAAFAGSHHDRSPSSFAIRSAAVVAPPDEAVLAQLPPVYQSSEDIIASVGTPRAVRRRMVHADSDAQGAAVLLAVPYAVDDAMALPGAMSSSPPRYTAEASQHLQALHAGAHAPTHPPAAPGSGERDQLGDTMRSAMSGHSGRSSSAARHGRHVRASSRHGRSVGSMASLGLSIATPDGEPDGHVAELLEWAGGLDANDSLLAPEEALSEAALLSGPQAVVLAVSPGPGTLDAAHRAGVDTHTHDRVIEARAREAEGHVPAGPDSWYPPVHSRPGSGGRMHTGAGRPRSAERRRAGSAGRVRVAVASGAGAAAARSPSVGGGVVHPHTPPVSAPEEWPQTHRPAIVASSGGHGRSRSRSRTPTGIGKG